VHRSYFTVDDKIVNNITVNQAKRGRMGLDRGHFYVVCPFKNTHIRSGTNYHPGTDYGVETKWVQDWWRQGKIDKVTECAGMYKCLTPHLNGMVMASNLVIQKKQAEAAVAARQAALQSAFLLFKTYPEITEWMEQYKTVKARYKFLILAGPSMTGKTRLAMQLMSNPWHHKGSINWVGYNHTDHTHIIFDDIHNIRDYIMMSKMLFQGSGSFTVNTSATNCYAQEIDTVNKPLIVCTNDYTWTDWILANSVMVLISSPTWFEHHPLTDGNC
jgi:hypothetical protein